MTAFRGHLVGDNAIWQGIDWYMAFSVSNANGTAYDLTNYTATATVHNYAGGTASAMTMTGTIDTPKTAGTGVLNVTAANSSAVRAGKYVYLLKLVPSAPSLAIQPVVFWGDIEVRDR